MEGLERKKCRKWGECFCRTGRNAGQHYDELRAIYEEAEYDFKKCDESTINKYITLRDVWLEAKERYEQTRDDRLDKREQIAEKQEEIAKIQVETTALQNKAEKKNLDVKQSYESAVLEKELTEVETGFTDGIHIQITRGLSEGDTIYIKSRVAGGVADE